MNMINEHKAEGVLACEMNDYGSVTLTCELDFEKNKVAYVVDAPDNRGFYKRYSTYAAAKAAYDKQVAEISDQDE